MSKLKNIIFITCLIFSLAQFCLGDDVIEDKVNNLEESDQQKEQRIADLEAKNIELITELQNLGIKVEEAQKNNLNESTLAQRIANLEARNIELVAELQKLVKDTGEDNSQTLLIVLTFVVILILILAFIAAFIWFKKKKEKELIPTETDYEAGEITSKDKNQPKPEPQPAIVNTANENDFFEQQSKDESDVKKDDDCKEVSKESLCPNANTKPITEEAKPKIIAVGNPGAGKSTILNSLAGEVLFESGFNAGGGLTYKLDERRNKNGQILLDTPGLADEEMRKKAGEAISEGLRKGGSYKVIFFVTQEAGRVNQQDATTLKLVLEAAPDIGMDYGIIVNKVSPGVLKKFKDEALKFEFLNTLFAGIEERKCVYSNVKFFGRISELEDEKDKFFSPTKLKDDSDLSLSDFVQDWMPTVEITDINVADIDIELFDDMKKKMESMAKQVLENDDKWKEDRQKLEAQRIKDNEDHRKQVKEIEIKNAEKFKALEAKNAQKLVDFEHDRQREAEEYEKKQRELEAKSKRENEELKRQLKEHKGKAKKLENERKKDAEENRRLNEKKEMVMNLKLEQLKKDQILSEQDRQIEVKKLEDQITAGKIEAQDQFNKAQNQFKKLEEDHEREKKRLEKELQEKSEFQDLLEQVKPWRFVGEDLFQKAKDYIDVQTQGIRSLALAYSKGLIIENSSKYKLIYKESKFTCGYPLKTFDDDEMLFNNKCIPPNTAVAQFSQNYQAKHLLKGVANVGTFGISAIVHQCHVLGYVSLMFEDPEDDNEQHIVSLGFSTGRNRSNTAGVQFRSISEEDMEQLALRHKHSKSQFWETFIEQDEKIAVECKFDNKSYSIVHFKFSNR